MDTGDGATLRQVIEGAVVLGVGGKGVVSYGNTIFGAVGDDVLS